MDVRQKLPAELVDMLDWIYLKAKKSNPALTEELFWEMIVRKYLETYRVNPSPLSKNQAELRTRIKEALKLRGKTQEQVSKEIGVNRAYLNHVINGRYEPSISLALLLSRSLGLSVEDLFYLEPVPEE